jgi:hypothetical protein
VTLPGGFELVLHDIREKVGDVQAQVDESSRRVEDLAATVQELLFEGAPVSPERRAEISEAVGRFGEFLTSCGLPLPAVRPTVRIEPEAEYSYYLPEERQIVMPANDPKGATEAFRLYAHPVLEDVYEGRDPDLERLSVEYGLTFYFVASYEGSLHFNDESLQDLRLKSARESAENHPLAAFPVGAAWSQLFWRLRDAATPSGADHALARAWVESVGRRGQFSKVFARELVDAVRDHGGAGSEEALRHELRREGIRV